MAKSIRKLKAELRAAALEDQIIKSAKYRVKNEEGKYEVIHFETSAEQVKTSDEKQFVSAAEKAEYADKYTKAEVDAKVATVDSDFKAADKVLDDRITAVETELGEAGKIKELSDAIEALAAEDLELDSKIENTKTDLGELTKTVGTNKSELEGKITTLKGEVDTYKTDNDARVGALETGKADKVHSHAIADVTGLSDQLATLETKAEVDKKVAAGVTEAKAYTDTEVEKVSNKVDAAKTELEASKVAKADVVNALDVVEEGKVLDARAGKTLKDSIDAKASLAEMNTALAGKAEKEHTHNVSDVKGLGTAATMNVGVQEGELVAVGAGNKIDVSLLPSLAINETKVVASVEEAMSVQVETGDIVIINAEAVDLYNASEMLIKSIAAGIKTFIVVDPTSEDFDVKFRPLVSGSDSISKGEVEQALAGKLDKSTYATDKEQINASIATKANSADVYTKTEIDGKTSALTQADEEIRGELTSSVSDLEGKIAKKADAAETTAAINAKADKTYVDAELGKKASIDDVTAAVEVKADKTYVDNTMATKTQLTEGLASKANVTDIEQVNTKLSEKASKTELTDGLATKANVETTYTKVEVDAIVKSYAPTVSNIQPTDRPEGHVWLEIVQ
jgi:hypothetical protein